VVINRIFYCDVHEHCLLPALRICEIYVTLRLTVITIISFNGITWLNFLVRTQCFCKVGIGFFDIVCPNLRIWSSVHTGLYGLVNIMYIGKAEFLTFCQKSKNIDALGFWHCYIYRPKAAASWSSLFLCAECTYRLNVKLVGRFRLCRLRTM
jgi:hypothetical protein